MGQGRQPPMTTCGALLTNAAMGPRLSIQRRGVEDIKYVGESRLHAYAQGWWYMRLSNPRLPLM